MSGMFGKTMDLVIFEGSSQNEFYMFGYVW